MNLELKTAIRKSGKKQIAIAEEVGIKPIQLSNIIHGRRKATGEEKTKIALCLDVWPRDIFKEG